jgi:hypothetical protein
MEISSKPRAVRVDNETQLSHKAGAIVWENSKDKAELDAALSRKLANSHFITELHPGFQKLCRSSSLIPPSTRF